jgi:hypothetical protein
MAGKRPDPGAFGFSAQFVVNRDRKEISELSKISRMDAGNPVIPSQRSEESGTGPPL